METSTLRVVALAGGVGVALLGVGVYQAWWTTAFAVGGLSIALMPGHVAPVRGLVFGTAITGAGLLGGMSLFLLYGALWGGAWWLLASVGSFLAALALAMLAWHVRRGAASRDLHQR